MHCVWKLLRDALEETVQKLGVQTIFVVMEQSVSSPVIAERERFFGSIARSIARHDTGQEQ